MNYEILRHINNLYDHVEILNSQIETINRQYSRLSRQNDRREIFQYNNPLFIPPLYGVRNRRAHQYTHPPNLDEIITELNNRRNRRNMNTTNVTNTNISSNVNAEPLNTNTTNTAATNSTATNSTATNSTATNTAATNSIATNTAATNSIATNTAATNSIATNSIATNSIATNTTNGNSNATETNTPFNENFATSFAQRIHNILSAVNDNEFPTNIQIETHTQVIISHKSVSNNTTIEIFNNSPSQESQRNILEDERTDLTESTESTATTESTTTTDSNNEYKCLICMENIQNNSIVRRLNKCNHVFHVDCIDKWFERKITCPTCRQDIRELPAVNNENQNNINIE